MPDREPARLDERCRNENDVESAWRRIEAICQLMPRLSAVFSA
jgi:hypothetical protein